MSVYVCVYVCGNDVELEGCGKSLLGKRDAYQSGTSEIGFEQNWEGDFN